MLATRDFNCLRSIVADRMHFESELLTRNRAKLPPRLVKKPWGRDQLSWPFVLTSHERIGELWFVNDRDLPLLPKYLFTSEALSIQVHPDDDQAQSRGLTRGKSECWYVLDAEPDAVIGLGLRHEISRAELRHAALDGSIERLMQWRPVSRGDFFYIPPGTIHALGGGLTLLELQQNSDVTYRLYDYGRPRQLHLDDAVAVAHCGPYPQNLFQKVNPTVTAPLVDGPHFTLLHTHHDALQDRQRWILPIDGYATFGDEIAVAGECLLIEAGERLDAVGGRLLISAAARTVAIELQAAA